MPSQTVATTRKRTTSSTKKSARRRSTTKKTRSAGKPVISGSSNATQLVIVESPAKAKTIQKFLGEDFAVTSSKGHIVDLPKKGMSIDIDDNYTPTYVVSDDKKTLVKELKKHVKQYETIWLATDEDREGEAIARHLQQQLKLPKHTPRITFNQITKSAIQDAITSPRTIDTNLVDAQQGRRVLDRLVGFSLSPVLREKIRKGLSAGRVQSVAVKMIVEKEEEIKAFIPVESWKLHAHLLSTSHENTNVDVELTHIHDKKRMSASRSDLSDIINALDITSQPTQISDKKTGHDRLTRHIGGSSSFILDTIETKKGERKPPKPLTTSSLQQEASRRFGRSVSNVMRTAQKLYEVGYITYMRTDSTNISSQSLDEIEQYITQEYGKPYHNRTMYSTKRKNAQEAHEAIRPTQISRTAAGTNEQQVKLYQLIRSRTVASQMTNARYDTTVYTFVPHNTPRALGQKRTTKGVVQTFDGFARIYSGNTEKEVILPSFTQGDILSVSSVLGAQQFSKPPARYSEASLVKALESAGIGRPSTYAPTIETIQKRGYVVIDENKKLTPTDTASAVTTFLDKHFPTLMDYTFTATMEQRLDDIAAGKEKRYEMIDTFYQPFLKDITKSKNASKALMYVGSTCPSCGSKLVYKFSSNRKFIGCENYPDCTYTEPMPEEKAMLDAIRARYEGKPCPEGGTIVVKMGRFGPFLASSDYPTVKRIGKVRSEKEEALEKQYGGIPCDTCQTGTMHVKKSRKRGVSFFLGCSNYPDCKNVMNLPT